MTAARIRDRYWVADFYLYFIYIWIHTLIQIHYSSCIILW